MKQLTTYHLKWQTQLFSIISFTNRKFIIYVDFTTRINLRFYLFPSNCLYRDRLGDGPITITKINITIIYPPRGGGRRVLHVTYAYHSMGYVSGLFGVFQPSDPRNPHILPLPDAHCIDFSRSLLIDHTHYVLLPTSKFSESSLIVLSFMWLGSNLPIVGHV